MIGKGTIRRLAGWTADDFEDNTTWE